MDLDVRLDDVKRVLKYGQYRISGPLIQRLRAVADVTVWYRGQVHIGVDKNSDAQLHMTGPAMFPCRPAMLSGLFTDLHQYLIKSPRNIPRNPDLWLLKKDIFDWFGRETGVTAQVVAMNPLWRQQYNQFIAGHELTQTLWVQSTVALHGALYPRDPHTGAIVRD